MKTARRESVAIAALLAAAILFGLWILPAGISLGGAGPGEGLSPRFMPRLATAAMVLALAWGLLSSLTGTRSPRKPREGRQSHIYMPIGGVAICLAFAGVGFALVGFYIGGICMAALLTVLLGERRPWVVIVFPTLLLAAIYLLFELALNVRLPRSGLIPGLPI